MGLFSKNKDIPIDLTSHTGLTKLLSDKNNLNIIRDVEPAPVVAVPEKDEKTEEPNEEAEKNLLTLKGVDGKILNIKIGSKFFLNSKEYEITGTRKIKGGRRIREVIQIQDVLNKEKEAEEITQKEFKEYFKTDKLTLPISTEREEELRNFSKKGKDDKKELETKTVEPEIKKDTEIVKPDIIEKSETEAWTEKEEKQLQEIMNEINQIKERMNIGKIEIKKLKDELNRQEQEEEKSKHDSFNIEFIKEKIEKIIKEQDVIKNVEGLSIVPGENNDLILSVNKITAKKFGFTTDITLKNAHIINSGTGIVLAEGFTVSATKFENKVKNMISENMNNLNDEIKKILEKETNKKITKIWIENGELKAL